MKKGIINLIKSMTGYGRAVETVNGREFTVELRSVNNRYLDCSVRLPRMLSFAEDAVKQAITYSHAPTKAIEEFFARAGVAVKKVFAKTVDFYELTD